MWYKNAHQNCFKWSFYSALHCYWSLETLYLWQTPNTKEAGKIWHCPPVSKTNDSSTRSFQAVSLPSTVQAQLLNFSVRMGIGVSNMVQPFEIQFTTWTFCQLREQNLGIFRKQDPSSTAHQVVGLAPKSSLAVPITISVKCMRWFRLEPCK